MEISDEARKILDKKVQGILDRIDVPPNQLSDIRKELISDHTDAAIIKAQERGATIVSGEDMTSACRTSETVDEIASLYMASFVNSLHRAGIISRSVAYVIDTIIIDIIALIVMLPFFPVKLILGLMSYIDVSKISDLSTLMHEYYMIITINLIITFVYFVVCEAHFGRTPGKWLLGLKVLSADGKKASYKEAMLRSIPKLFILAIIADAIIMELVFRKERQRLFDRIADTIVISGSRK